MLHSSLYLWEALQCAAVCCSLQQCVAVCCSVSQCAAVCCRVLQCVLVCGSVQKFAAVCSSVLQGVAAYVVTTHLSVWQRDAVCFILLQRVAAGYSVL